MYVLDLLTLRHLKGIMFRWDDPAPRPDSVPEGWHRAAVLSGGLVTDEHSDPVYCIGLAFLEPAVVEGAALPVAFLRISLNSQGVPRARRFLESFGLTDPKQLLIPLPKLYARVLLGPVTGLCSTLSERTRDIQVVPERVGDAWGLKLPPQVSRFTD